MDVRRVMIIINPIAGTSSKRGLDEYLISRLLAKGWTVDVTFTMGHGDATQIAKSAVAHGFSAVIAAGGDGTVNETAAALCDTGVALGIIPCGSGNGLARHLNIPVDVGEGLKVIEENHVVDIDYGTLCGKQFFCTCGVGFDAAVSEKFAHKKSRGLVTYIRSVIEEYQNFKPADYKITIGDKVLTEKAFLIAVCNASQYGNNAYIAPDAAIDDGLFDVTVVHAASPLRTALVGFDMLAGFINHNTLIRNFRVPELMIERTDGGPVHMDGEPMHIDTPLTLKCHPLGLKVFTPTTSRPFQPIITPVNSLMRDMRLAVKHLLHIR